MQDSQKFNNIVNRNTDFLRTYIVFLGLPTTSQIQHTATPLIPHVTAAASTKALLTDASTITPDKSRSTADAHMPTISPTETWSTNSHVSSISPTEHVTPEKPVIAHILLLFRYVIVIANEER